MMKNFKRLFATLTLLATATASANSDVAISKNLFLQRAFSANIARELLMEGHVTSTDFDGFYSFFSATGVYQRAWNQSDDHGIGAFPFWSGTNQMTVGTNDGLSSLDAYQFGLGNVTANGSITLDPIVYQAGADFMFVVGSSANEPCFFAKIKAPVGVYNINPNLTEVAAVPSVYTAGQISQAAAQTADVASTMTQAFAGNLAGGQNTLGDFVPMQFGLLNGDQSTGAKFGDIEMTAGYRFISNEDNSFSVAVRAAAPTGGQATGEFMMEPIFGRGGNWALGGYLDGHVRLWEGNNENCILMKFMANAQHLFNTDTVRSYDLIENGGGSKYLLVGNFAGGAYNNQVQNLINVSTLDSTSSFGVEGDVVVAFTYMGRGWSLDLGYEFWGRSAETLEITGAFAADTYAVLGRQAVGAATSPYAATLLAQPTATISSAVASGAGASVVSATSAANQISVAQFNVEAAQQDTALTSKVFSKVTYEWVESNYRPHLGVMGEFEISTSNNNALPQWSIALMGGVSF